MKMLLIISLFTFSSYCKVCSQVPGDKKIIIKLTDTSNVYNRVKLAIIKAGFTVKDDMNSHVLTSNVTIKKILGYTVVKAEINKDTVTVSGRYSNKNQNLFDIEIAPGKYKNIVYFKNNRGEGWDILYAIAIEIDANDLSYSE